MARKYAPGSLPGLSGTIATSVNGVPVNPGDPLPPGTTSFEIRYFFTARFLDANGFIYESRFLVEEQNVSVNDSNATIVSKLQKDRSILRQLAKAANGPPLTTL